MLQSVENPVDRYFLEFEEHPHSDASKAPTITFKINKDKQRRDLLSPLPFSAPDDSMGAYKEGAWKYDSILYGGAIVEFRSISRSSLASTEDSFLSQIDLLKCDAEKLLVMLQSQKVIA
jgi:hypothetical protein